MATLVAFHAHPDDECLLQSGSLAKAVHDGHRVVVVYATRGEVGQAPDGLLYLTTDMPEGAILKLEPAR